MEKQTKTQKVVEQLNILVDSIKNKAIKIRDCNFNPNTGIYLEDKELNIGTMFKPGTKIRYQVDVDNKVLKIIPSDSIGTSVAVRERNGNVSSVIHVRRKEIIDLFKDSKKLEFEIFEDSIIVKNKDTYTDGMPVDTNNYSVSIKDVKALADKSVDEEIRRTVANHTAKHPVLQGIFDVVKKPLRFLSLFSGSGLMDYAFKLEGFECELAVEMNDSAVKTFKANHDSPIFHGDINDIDFDEVAQVDLVIGGPPCQDFSLQNSKRDEGENSRNNLVFKFAEAVKKVKAKMFVIENVPQLFTAKAAYYINSLKKFLPEFELSTGVLNSADYGSAQIRERAIIIGSRIGRIELPLGNPNKRKTVREAFAGITDDMPNAKDYSKPTPKTIERMQYVPQGGNWTSIPEEKRTKGKFSNNFRRLDWNSQSCTIVNVARTIIIHPEENRVPTIRELARLQGAPDSYKFLGTLFDKQQQLANTISVELMQAIAKQIKAKYEEIYNCILMDRFQLQTL